jgi:hypothetical protein
LWPAPASRRIITKIEVGMRFPRAGYDIRG